MQAQAERSNKLFNKLAGRPEVAEQCRAGREDCGCSLGPERQELSAVPAKVTSEPRPHVNDEVTGRTQGIIAQPGKGLERNLGGEQGGLERQTSSCGEKLILPQLTSNQASPAQPAEPDLPLGKVLQRTLGEWVGSGTDDILSSLHCCYLWSTCSGQMQQIVSIAFLPTYPGGFASSFLKPTQQVSVLLTLEAGAGLPHSPNAEWCHA